MDLIGLHKVYVMGVVYKDIACIGMMDMGVGKSMLLLEMLKEEEVEFLSDDTSLVNQEGGVESFPIRIGIANISKSLNIIDFDINFYELHREYYGIKKLVSLDGISNKVGIDYKDIVLFEGLRNLGKAFGLVEMSKFLIWLSLQKHMVVGIGLSLIFEYFWEIGFTDFYRKTKIFILRQIAAYKLVRRSRSYKLYMSNKFEDNAKVLKFALERLFRS